MALTLGDNFSYQGAKPLDARLKYATLAEMKAVADATMYDGCMAYCVATDKTYQWKLANTVDADTGRWREFSSGGGGSSEDENAYHITDSAETAIADTDYFPFQDVSANDKKKSLWSNIKSVLKTYFDTIYSTVRTSSSASSGGTALSLVTTGEKYTWNNKQNALTAGTNIGISGNVISGTNTLALNLSTTAQIVGKWDGKDLYAKLFKGTSSSAVNTLAYVGSDTLPSGAKVRFLQGTLIGNDIVVPVNMTYDNSTRTCFYQSGTRITGLVSSSNYTSKTVQIVAYYTLS